MTKEDRRRARPYIATTSSPSSIYAVIQGLDLARHFLERLYGPRNYKLLGLKVNRKRVRLYYTVKRCRRIRISNIDR